MKKAFFLAVLMLCSSQVSAQAPAEVPPEIPPPEAPAQAHLYDVFYGLPGEAGSLGIDVGILSSDVSSIGDVSDVPLMAKYGINGNLEVGARVTFGFLNDGRDSFSSVLAGGKYMLGENNAISVNVLLPVGDADDPGLSVGYMMSMEAFGLLWNDHLQVGLLDGYTQGTGINIDLLLEPYKELNDKMVGYLDILIATNTDEIGDNLGINLGPNVDYILNDGLAVNAGVTVGIAGDQKQDDVGIGVVLLKAM